jgi:hypothetical protein
MAGPRRTYNHAGRPSAPAAFRPECIHPVHARPSPLGPTMVILLAATLLAGALATAVPASTSGSRAVARSQATDTSTFASVRAGSPPAREIDLATAGAVTIVGSPDNDQLGDDLAVGNLNGDAIVDLAIGAHWSGGAGRNIVGRTYALFGRRSWPPITDLYGHGASDWSFRGGGRESRLGASVAVADLGGDATDDLIMGAVLDDPGGQIDAGAVHIAFGGPGASGDVDLAYGRADVLLAGDSRTGDQLGTDLVVGDFNGDGHRDLAVAAANRERGVGAVFVWWGPFRSGDTRNLRDNDADWTIVGPGTRAWFGSALAAGDLDADGVDDLVIAAARATTEAAGGDGGAVFVFRGGPRAGGAIDLARDQADTTVTGPPGAMIGMARSTLCACRGRPLGVADITGDGQSDLIVGAPLDAGRRGRVWVLPGPLPLGAVALASVGFGLAGVAPDDRLGWAVAVQDIDGDSGPDLLVAAPNASAGERPKAGRVYAVMGPIPSSDGLPIDRSAALIVAGPAASSGNAGIALAVGDLDADGQADLVAGFPDAAPAGRNASGAVYLIRGPLLPRADPKPSPTPALPTWGPGTATASATPGSAVPTTTMPAPPGPTAVQTPGAGTPGTPAPTATTSSPTAPPASPAPTGRSTAVEPASPPAGLVPRLSLPLVLAGP